MSAVCVPVTFTGRALGVLHSTGAPGERPDPEQLGALAMLACQGGARIGTLRSFERAQLQASTDGLTGMLNRRGIRDESPRPASQGRAGRGHHGRPGPLQAAQRHPRTRSRRPSPTAVRPDRSQRAAGRRPRRPARRRGVRAGTARRDGPPSRRRPGPATRHPADLRGRRYAHVHRQLRRLLDRHGSAPRRRTPHGRRRSCTGRSRRAATVWCLPTTGTTATMPLSYRRTGSRRSTCQPDTTTSPTAPPAERNRPVVAASAQAGGRGMASNCGVTVSKYSRDPGL